MGEEGRPQGVGVGGRRARGVKGGEGREESPVPPIMAMGTGSGGFVSGICGVGGGEGSYRDRWWGDCPCLRLRLLVIDSVEVRSTEVINIYQSRQVLGLGLFYGWFDESGDPIF